MQPQGTERVGDPEKNPESTGLLAPPAPDFPGYYAVYHPLPVITEDRLRNLRRRRFWHFFACLFTFIIALHLLSPRHYIDRLRKGTSMTDSRSNWQCANNVNWTNSTQGDHDPEGFHASATFTLPVTSTELNFVAEGGLSSGVFDISQSEEPDLDNAIVDIDVSYRHPGALEHAQVCRLHAADDEWGLGIFTPHRWPHHPHRQHDHLRFHIHLRLPASDALTIKSLKTNLPLFAHHLHQLAPAVFFKDISLRTSNAPITADSLAGETLHLHSSNGEIHGNYNASKSLELETSNAPISVHVDLHNDPAGSATKLLMRTSNGRIVSDVALVSSASDGSKGVFDVGARTSNSPLALSVTDAPVDSVLTAVAHTSNSPARVDLHKTFEGAFELHSSAYFRPTVEWDGGVEDPAGRGRTRRVDVDSVRGGDVRGSVAWGDEGEGKGRVSVETSNSPLRLLL